MSGDADAAVSRRRDGMTAAILFALAFALRAATVLAVAGPAADALPLERSSAFWPPLPWLMAHAVAAVLGVTKAALLLYAAVGALVAPVVHRLAREAGVGPGAAAFAGVAVAALPYYVGAAASQPPTGISVVLTAALTLAAFRAVRVGGAGTHAAVFLTVVLALADRPNVVSYVAFLAAAVALSAAARPRRLAAIAAIAAAVLGYSGLRLAAYGRFTPFTANGGYNLALGHNPWTAGYLARHDIPSLERVAIDHPEVVAGDDAERRDRALAFARENPGRTLSNTARKALRYWDWRLESADLVSPLKNLAYAVPYVALLALAGAALVGVARGVAPAAAVMLPLLGWIAYAVPSLVTLPLVRMRMYSEFLLVLAAAAGAAVLTRAVSRGADGSRLR